MNLPISGVVTIKNFFRIDQETSIPYIRMGQPNSLKFCMDREYNIPAYQRGISWNQVNAQILLKDLTTSKKFLGNILLSCNDGKKFDIIDGQQRISVILMILKSLKRYSEEGYDFEHCKFTNKSFPLFFEAMSKEFDYLEGNEKVEYERVDVLDQHSTMKLLWNVVCEYIDKLDGSGRQNLYDNLLNSYITIIISEVIEGLDSSRRLCVDYFIDINNKSVQLEYVDILKAYAFRESFEFISTKWEVIQKKTKALKLKGTSYSKEQLFYHYLLCTINNTISSPIKKGITEELKIAEDVNLGEKTYKKGSDIELLINKPMYYKNMFTKIEEFIDFLFMVASDGITPGNDFCNKFKVEGRTVDFDVISNAFAIISNIMKNSDVVPKVLLMKYYLCVVCNNSKTEEDIKSIYWVNALAVLFSASKTESKSISAFSMLVLKADFVKEVKKLAVKRLGTFPGSIGFSKSVMQDRVVTSTSGQMLSRRVNAMLGAYVDCGVIEKIDEKKLKDLLNTQGVYNDEHFLVNESFTYSFKYRGDKVEFALPGKYKDMVSYLGNYIKIKSSINTELGTNMIKDKIRIIRQHIENGEKDVFGNKFSELMFYVAEECFENSDCMTEMELQKVESKEEAIERAQQYYMDFFEEDMKTYLERITDIAYVVTALRKKKINKPYMHKWSVDGSKIEGEVATAEGVFGFQLNAGVWPLFRLCADDLDTWTQIKDKALSGMIQEEDLSTSDLQKIYEYIKLKCDWTVTCINDYFGGLKDLDLDKKTKCIYCFVNFIDEASKPVFFISKEELQRYFIDNYCHPISCWIKMEKKTFDLYNKKMEEEFEEFCVCYVDDLD